MTIQNEFQPIEKVEIISDQMTISNHGILMMPESNGRGRPTKYDPDLCNVVIEKGKEGCTITEMAVACGVVRDTIHEWIKEKPEFSDAMKKAVEFSQAWWEEQMRKGMKGEIPNFNATIAIFNMKNRFPKDWREKVEVETKTTNQIDISQMSEEQQLAILDALKFVKTIDHKP